MSVLSANELRRDYVLGGQTVRHWTLLHFRSGKVNLLQ